MRKTENPDTITIAMKKMHKKFRELISIVKFCIINNNEAKPPADIIRATELNNAINTMEEAQREIISPVGTSNANKDRQPPPSYQKAKAKPRKGALRPNPRTGTPSPRLAIPGETS